MAETYNLTQGQAGIPFVGLDKVYTMDLTVNCATNNIGSGETAALFNIPAYHQVLNGQVNVTTVEGGTATADIGVTGVDADGIIDGVNLNSAGLTTTISSDAGAIIGTVTPQTSAYQVALLANNALDAAVFKVTILVANMS